MISMIPVVERSPKDVTSDTKQRYSEESDNDKSDDEEGCKEKEESSEEGEEAESPPSYEAPKEPRSKALHDVC